MVEALFIQFLIVVDMCQLRIVLLVGDCIVLGHGYEYSWALREEEK